MPYRATAGIHLARLNTYCLPILCLTTMPIRCLGKVKKISVIKSTQSVRDITLIGVQWWIVAGKRFLPCLSWLACC